MPFLISPGVSVVEKDLSALIPAVATSPGAFAGVFSWGPVLEPTIIATERGLLDTFHTPSDDNFTSWYTVANFLAYSNNINVVRVVGTGALNAISDNTKTAVLIKGEEDFEENYMAGEADVGMFAAKYAGVLGNSLAVSIADQSNFSGWPYQALFLNKPDTSEQVAGMGGSQDEVCIVVIDEDGLFTGVRGTVLEKFTGSKAVDAKSYDGTSLYYADIINRSSAYIWWMDHKTSGLSALAGEVAWGLGSTEKFKTIASLLTVTFGGAGSGATGYVSKVGSAGEVLEITVTAGGTGYTGTPTVAIGGTGAGTGFVGVVVANAGVIESVTITTAGSGYSSVAKESLTKGHDGATPTDAQIIAGWSLFSATDVYDVSLIPAGKASPTVANYLVQNIAEVRKDCVVFLSPHDVDNSAPIIGNKSAQIIKMKAYWDAVGANSSYGFMDSGYKYQYDRYADKYRWVPLNGDVAGLCARTDATNDPWWSPAGLNRGFVKNVTKLACNPADVALRDELYKYNINPVVTFPGQGTVLWGDKTMQKKPSAFDRINVRRLFIVLEKAIATAAKYQLFELNDTFTRALFRNMVEPFLRDVQGRRGIYDFKVVCDETNNTPEVIDRNEFIADIYLKPAKSINFIYLNFIATRTGANFSELIGKA